MSEDKGDSQPPATGERPPSGDPSSESSASHSSRSCAWQALAHARADALREFELASSRFLEGADEAAGATVHPMQAAESPLAELPAVPASAPLSAGVRALLVTAVIHSTTMGMSLLTGPSLQLSIFDGSESEAAELNTIMAATLGGQSPIRTT